MGTTLRLSSTVMEIWPFEVLSERLFQEQRSVVGQDTKNGQLHCKYLNHDLPGLHSD